MSLIRAEDLVKAGNDLQTIPFYPQGEGAQAAVLTFLAKICPHREALVWLVGRMCEACKSWPGLGEVRGLLCTRYRPADGVEAWCSLPGYSAEDCESQPPMSVSEARARLAEVAPKLLEAKK